MLLGLSSQVLSTVMPCGVDSDWEHMVLVPSQASFNNGKPLLVILTIVDRLWDDNNFRAL